MQRQTIDRIIDVFPPHQQAQIRIQLASVLEAIISQRLFQRADVIRSSCSDRNFNKSPSVANLIRNEKVHQIENVIQTSQALGMHTLEMSIQELLGWHNCFRTQRILIYECR